MAYYNYNYIYYTYTTSVYNNQHRYRIIVSSSNGLWETHSRTDADRAILGPSSKV